MRHRQEAAACQNVDDLFAQRENSQFGSLTSSALALALALNNTTAACQNVDSSVAQRENPDFGSDQQRPIGDQRFHSRGEMQRSKALSVVASTKARKREKYKNASLKKLKKARKAQGWKQLHPCASCAAHVRRVEAEAGEPLVLQAGYKFGCTSTAADAKLLD